jgi:transcriptional regulator with XRE-family HTH domain
MLDTELIRKLVQLKEEKGYTLHDLSKRLDLQVTTIERWLKTRRINKVYAQLVREKLNID